MRYLVRIYGHNNTYSAMLPDLPGCVAVEQSVEKVKKLIAEAVHLHLELMRESGEGIPSPSQHLEFRIDESEDEEYCTWVEVKDPDSITLHPAKSRRKEKITRIPKKAM